MSEVKQDENSGFVTVVACTLLCLAFAFFISPKALLALVPCFGLGVFLWLIKRKTL